MEVFLFYIHFRLSTGGNSKFIAIKMKVIKQSFENDTKHQASLNCAMCVKSQTEEKKEAREREERQKWLESKLNKQSNKKAGY